MNRRHLALAFLLTLGLHSFAPSQSPAPRAASSADTLEALRATGITALYNLDYAVARTKFEEMVKLAPDHPAGHYYLATNHWLSLLHSMRRLQIGLYADDAFFAGNADLIDPQLEREFRDAVTKAINVSQARVRANRNDVVGLYYLGAAYGMLASYEATATRNFRSALRNGDRGVEYHRKVVKLDPHFADAYLSIGLYDYMVGKLPWLVRWGLRLVKASGNRQRGLAEIRQAMEQGKYVNDDARIVLIALYQREENYGEARKLLEELSTKYPQNYLFRIERAVALEQVGQSCESYAAFEQLLKDERAQGAADLIHYRYGEVLLKGGAFARAREHFEAVAKAPQQDPALASLAHLRHGQALDALGQHADAREQYQLVLRRANAFDSHNQARAYRESPYTPQKTLSEKCTSGR